MNEVVSKTFEELLKDEPEVKVPPKEDNALEVPQNAFNEALDSTPTSLAPTELEKRILEGFSTGKTIPQLAISIGITEGFIRTYLRNPKVKEYLRELKEAMNEIDQMLLTSTVRKILVDRIDELGDDESFAKLSNKDTLDVIKTFADISNQITKAQSEEKSDDIFVNIYQQILEK